MHSFVIVTAAGPDRPGIVAGLTRALYETGCNIEDTSMTLLRGEFAMMLIVRLPHRLTLSALERRFRPVQKTLRLSLHIKPLSSKEARRGRHAAERSFILSVYGSDRPGIVYRVTKLLSSLAINITDMNTRVIGSQSRPVYVMILEVEIPEKIRIESLKTRLHRLQKGLGVDISLHPAEPIQL
jgi:glycine cleavage system transcriptional repressor